MMNRKWYRLCQVIFNRFQSSSANRLSKGTDGDVLWRSLTGREHQLIGKTIAKYGAAFENNCPVAVKVVYGYTDEYGNGIYNSTV